MATTRLRYVNAASSGGDGTTNATSGAQAAYASLNAALAAEHTAGSDLVASDEIVRFECEGSTVDAVRPAHTSTWVTDATRYVEIVAVGAHRHDGKWDTTAYRIVGGTNAARVIINGIGHLRIQGIQVENTATGSSVAGITVGYASATNCDIRVEECVVRILGSASSISAAIQHSSGSGGAVRIGNNLCIAAGTVASGQGILLSSNGPSHYCYNNTIVGFNHGLNRTNGTGTGRATNNIILDLVSGEPITGGANWDSADYNATDAASLGTGLPSGTGNRLSQTFTFVDEPNDDYHLDNADGGAKGFGTDLSADADYAVAVDIDGTTRPATWDIGADQVTVAGATYHDLFCYITSTGGGGGAGKRIGGGLI